MQSSVSYQIALTQLPRVGPVKAKILLAYCGDAEAVFREKQSALLRIPEVGPAIASAIHGVKAEVLAIAEKEMTLMEKYGIVPIFFTDSRYPERLKLCDDSPVLLFTRGKMNLNEQRVISVVGTRNATGYGKGFCEELIDGIAHLKPLVVSGMAYGVDIHTHRRCVDGGVQTVGVMAHGLDSVYPTLHLATSREMEKNGGLISEFLCQTKMAPELFPMRNRVVAGMADCTVVVESDRKGGSLITAHLASSYGREVFALPGRNSDKWSSGCNELIRKNVAAILTSPDDLVGYMNWTGEKDKKPRQMLLFDQYSEEETKVIHLLDAKGKLSIDAISEYSGFAPSKLSSILLNLEFAGVVKSLPGKIFDLE